MPIARPGKRVGETQERERLRSGAQEGCYCDIGRGCRNTVQAGVLQPSRPQRGISILCQPREWLVWWTVEVSRATHRWPRDRYRKAHRACRDERMPLRLTMSGLCGRLLKPKSLVLCVARMTAQPPGVSALVPTRGLCVQARTPLTHTPGAVRGRRYQEMAGRADVGHLLCVRCGPRQGCSEGSRAGRPCSGEGQRTTGQGA